MLRWLKRLFSGGGWVNKDPADDYWYTQRGVASIAGVDVTEGRALGLPTVYACVAKIAKTVASLPVQVYDKPNADTRQPVDHPLNDLFGGAASPEASGMSVSETRMANLLLWGMGYTFIEWAPNGREPLAFYPMESAYVTPRRNDQGELVFDYQEDGMGKPETIPAVNIFWVPGLSLGGSVGLSPIKYHRDTIGTHIAKRQFGGSFFKNGARPGGFIKRSLEADVGRMALSKDGAARMLASFNELFQGSENAYRWGLLREGMEAVPMPSMPLEDAQYIEGMQFDREDVCAIFDCPPSKIQDHTRSTFSNIEHLGIDWATDTILPWCVRVEQAVKRTFFRGQTLYLKHNLAGIARGDINSRYTAYATGRNWGWLSINDVRRLEDMNPVPNGDDYLQPLNMQVVGAPVVLPAAAVPREPEPDGEPGNGDQDDAAAAIRASVEEAEPPDERATIAKDLQPAIQAACKRLLAAESAAVDKAYKRFASKGDADGMDAWIDAYAAKRVDEVADEMRPVVETYDRLAGRVSDGKTEFIAKAWTLNMCAGIRTALDSGDFGSASRLNALDNQAAWVTRMLLGDRDDEKPNA